MQILEGSSLCKWPQEDEKDLLQEIENCKYIQFSNFLELLDDELSARGIFEVVGLEHLGDEEGLQVLYRDLASLLHKILLWHLNDLLVCAVPVAHVCGSFIGKAAEDEQQELVVVPLVGKVPVEVPLHVLHHAVLLGVNERLEHDTHGHVDVVLRHKLSQVHLGVGLCHPDHALDVTNCDGDGASGHALSPQLAVHLGNLLLVHLVELGVELLPRVDDILLQQVLRDLLNTSQVAGGGQLLLSLLHVLGVGGGGSGVVLHVGCYHKSRQMLISHWVNRVPHNTEDVEPREDWLGEVDVLGESHAWVISSTDWVGRGNDGAPRLQLGHDARLRDGDSLLLHCLVDRRPVAVVHLVKLVDQTDSLVGEHQSSSLQRPLLGQLRLLHVGSEADCRRSLPRREDCSWRDVLDVLQEARLSCSRISAHQHIQIATNLVLVSGIFGHASKERKGECTLDVVVAIDGRSNASNDALANALILRQGVDGLDIILGHGVRRSLLVIPHHMVGNDHRGKDGEPILGVQARVVTVTVDPRQLDLVTRSHLVTEVSEEKRILGPWKSSSSDFPRRFLQCDPLVVLVQSLSLVDLKRPKALALRAGARLGLLLLVLVEGAKHIATLGAVELDHEKLRQDAAAARNNTAGPDQLDEVKLSQTSQLLNKRQLTDANLDIGGNPLVVWVDAQNHLLGCLVKNFEHLTRCLREKIGKGLTFGSKNIIVDLKAASVLQAHVLDLHLENGLPLLIGVSPHEVPEPVHDLLPDAKLSNVLPDGLPLGVLQVLNALQCLGIVCHILLHGGHFCHPPPLSPWTLVLIFIIVDQGPSHSPPPSGSFATSS